MTEKKYTTSPQKEFAINHIEAQCESNLMDFLSSNPDITEIILDEDTDGKQLIKEGVIKALTKRSMDYAIRNANELQEADDRQKKLTDLLEEKVLTQASIAELCRVQIDQTINTARDVYARTVIEQELQSRILTHKTGLLNKIGHEQRLSEEISITSREGLPISLLIFDIDKFKKVNSDIGHLAADKIIQEIADRVKKVVRASDHPSCWGGDEFAITLHNADEKHAKIVAVRLSEAINRTPFITEDGKEIAITVSIGGAQFTNRQEDPIGENLFEKADYQSNILKGDKPDKTGEIGNRRGRICFGGIVMTKEEYREILASINKK